MFVLKRKKAISVGKQQMREKHYLSIEIDVMLIIES
jgi:hypothetical protein